MNSDRLYAVRLLWVHDSERFTEYQEKAKPILAKHGVHIERWLMTQDMEGEGFERPGQIVVTWFKSEAAKKAFEKRPAVRGSGQDPRRGRHACYHHG